MSPRWQGCLNWRLDMMWEQAGILALALVGAYTLGSVPTAYLLARWAKGIDLRRYGSGSVGASNAAAHVGKAALIGVAVVDIAKGALPVVLLRWLGVSPEVQALAGLAAVVGHNWSLYLRFTGGRGVATASGAVLGLGVPVALMAFFAGFLLVGYLRKESALWVGVGVVLVPGAAWLLAQPSAVVLACVGATVLLGAKRLTGNWQPMVPGHSPARVLLYRLVYDRDIRDRMQWVTRTPPAQVS